MNKKTLKIILPALIFFILIFSLMMLRQINPRQLDDLTPGISCSENIIQKSDVLWIIPNFNNTPINQNLEWCNRIKNLNKTLGLHGFKHTYEEFKTPRSREYLNEAISIFESCFNITPTQFKPPQLEISKENKQLIRNSNLRLSLHLNQLTHKVYHCSDTGLFSNIFLDFF